MSFEEFTAMYRARGYDQARLAAHWGVSRSRVWQIAHDAQRAPYWEDAVRGLPQRHKPLTGKRRGRPPGRRGRATAKPNGLRYQGYLIVGSVVTVASDFGEVAQEGDRGLVLCVRGQGVQEEYFIVFEHADAGDWFTPEMVDRHLAESGLVREELVGYRFESEAATAEQKRAGAFHFR